MRFLLAIALLFIIALSYSVGEAVGWRDAVNFIADKVAKGEQS